MRDLSYRLLVAWYRLTGNTQVQAEWRARQALSRPEEARDAVRGHARRAADRRFNCVCSQLLVEGDRTCHACGRRQYLPIWARSVLRLLGLAVPAATPGTLVVGLLMAIGYVAQLRYGEGSFGTPSKSNLELFDLGISVSWLTLGPQPWRAFTYTMLHGGLWHIGFNALALAQIGPLVEQRFGTARFLFAWVFGGAAGVMLPPLVGVSVGVPVLGASGAVFALIGMAMIHGHLEGTDRGRFIRDMMVRWTIYCTLFGLFLGNVAHGAHFGGLAAGALFGWAFPPADDNAARRRLTLPLALVSLGVVFTCLAAWGTWYAAGARPPDRLAPRRRSPGTA